MDRKPVLPSHKMPGLDCSGLACLPPSLRLCVAVAESSDTLYQTGEGSDCRGSVGGCGHRIAPCILRRFRYHEGCCFYPVAVTE